MAPIKIYLDSRELSVNEGETILDIARREGIHIPTLCYHPTLSPEASCRLCFVEDKKSNKLVPACATYAANGAQYATSNGRIHHARKFNLELLLARHPLDCMTCEKNGACELQDLAYEFQVNAREFGYAPRPGARDLSHPFIALEPEKCVLCHRCVRACAEIQGRYAIGIYARGANAHIAPEMERPWIESNCESCGTCIAICPTGALAEKPSSGKGRAWEFEKVATICPYCGVGCMIDLNLKDGRVVKVTSNWERGANHGALCVKGRFGYEFIHHPDRLTKPLVKKDGAFVETTWDDALSLIAQKFAETRGDSFAVLASAKATNEENYLIQKFARTVMGTNNVDHCARL